MATSSTPLNFIVPDDCTLKVALETASPWKPSIRSDYRVGLRILARYRTNGNFYPCKITAINEGGTYAVQFGEGKESEIQDATLFEDIKLKNKIEKANYSQLICNSTNIFLRAGTHNLNGNMVEIETPINIIGDGYENKIIINGGLLITGNQQLGKVVIRKVTLQSSKLHGLFINGNMSCPDLVIPLYFLVFPFLQLVLFLNYNGIKRCVWQINSYAHACALIFSVTVGGLRILAL